MEARIGMICSNLKLAEKVKRVSDRLGFPIEIRMGTLEIAIPITKDLEVSDIEVLISRGGTAAILKTHLAIPVLSIPFSTNDLLENVLEASNGKKDWNQYLWKSFVGD